MPFRNIGKRIDFVAFANPQGPATLQKERHVGTEACADRKKALARQTLLDQTQVANKSSRGVARPATQAPTGWNGFAKFNGHTLAGAELASCSVHRAVHQIFFDGLAGERIVAADAKFDA